MKSTSRPLAVHPHLAHVQYRLLVIVGGTLLLGGIGTMVGPIVGASLVVGLENTLATSGFPVTIATRLIFMVCVLVFRRELYARVLGRAGRG